MYSNTIACFVLSCAFDLETHDLNPGGVGGRERERENERERERERESYSSVPCCYLREKERERPVAAQQMKDSKSVAFVILVKHHPLHLDRRMRE